MARERSAAYTPLPGYIQRRIVSTIRLPWVEPCHSSRWLRVEDIRFDFYMHDHQGVEVPMVEVALGSGLVV